MTRDSQHDSHINRLPLDDKSRITDKCVCCGSHNIKSAPAILMPFVAHRAFGWEPIEINEEWGLKTINNGTAYSICKSLYCQECGFLFLDIRFSESELNHIYHDYRGEDYNNLREKYEPGYTLRNDSLNSGISYIGDIETFLEPHLKKPITILDWGGDTGKNTPFKDKAITLDIYDISEKPVLSGFRIVDKEDVFSSAYALICCSHVLEHVPYPSEVLLEITKAMNNDTIVYLEVPFEDVVRLNKNDLHHKKKHWHEHINFFSKKSLTKLVGNAGLTILSSKTTEVTAGGNLTHIFQLACKLKLNLI
jgi:hypothetical protein